MQERRLEHMTVAVFGGPLDQVSGGGNLVFGLSVIQVESEATSPSSGFFRHPGPGTFRKDVS